MVTAAQARATALQEALHQAKIVLTTVTSGKQSSAAQDNLQKALKAVKIASDAKEFSAAEQETYVRMHPKIWLLGQVQFDYLAYLSGIENSIRSLQSTAINLETVETEVTFQLIESLQVLQTTLAALSDVPQVNLPRAA